MTGKRLFSVVPFSLKMFCYWWNDTETFLVCFQRCLLDSSAVTEEKRLSATGVRRHEVDCERIAATTDDYLAGLIRDIDRDLKALEASAGAAAARRVTR